MEVNELMVGDYIGYLPTWLNEDGSIQSDGNPNNPIICKVKMLGSSSAQLDNGEDYFDVDDIELYPIPLTPEILEKNGFVKNKKCPFVYKTNDEDVIIDLYDPAPNARLSKKEDYDEMVGVRLSPAPPYGFSYWGQALIIRANYVHELQHALRLCGIEKEIEL